MSRLEKPGAFDAPGAPRSDGAEVGSGGLEGLFARKSSGLVRELGAKDTFAIGVGGINITAIPILALVVLTLFPQSDFMLPLAVGAAIGVLLAMVYAQLLATLPRSGGDYIYASRIFHPLVGAAVGGALFLALLIGVSPIPTYLAQDVVPFFFTAVGSALGSSAIADLGDDFGGKATQLITALVLLAGVFAITVRRTSSITRVVFWFTFGLAGLTLLTFAALFITHDHANFQASYDHYAHQAGSYNAVIAAAHGAGLKTGVSTSAAITAIPYGALVYLGLTYSAYTGGEVRRPGRTALLGAVMATVGTFVLATIYWLTLRHTAGLTFLQSAGWLSENHPEAFDNATSVAAFAPNYGLLLAGDPITKLVMAFGMLLGNLGAVIAYVLVMSRVLFSLAFDRLLPMWTTDVSARTHAPTKAIGITMLGISIFVVLAIYTSVVSVFRNTILIFEVLFTLSSIAAMILPYRGRDFYRASPKMYGTILGLPGITVLGAISTVVNGVMVYFTATKTQISGGFDAGSIITLVCVATIGLVAYAVSRYVLARRGTDLSLAMRELPPE